MSDFLFTNNSGYQQTIDRLKSQVGELVDETTPTPVRVFKEDSIHDYTFGTLDVVFPISGYPLFLITAGDEDPKENNGPVSEITLICYMCFNSNADNYNEQVNQIFSKLREIFKTDHNGLFKISPAIRSNKPPPFFATKGDYKPFYSIEFTITVQQEEY